jgi:hypothetical protein
MFAVCKREAEGPMLCLTFGRFFGLIKSFVERSEYAIECVEQPTTYAQNLKLEANIFYSQYLFFFLQRRFPSKLPQLLKHQIVKACLSCHTFPGSSSPLFLCGDNECIFRESRTFLEGNPSCRMVDSFLAVWMDLRRIFSP